MNIFKIRHQIGGQTYVAPEFVGSYLDCRHYLADRSADMRNDPAFDTMRVSLMARGGEQHLGSVGGYDEVREEVHVWVICRS